MLETAILCCTALYVTSSPETPCRSELGCKGSGPDLVKVSSFTYLIARVRLPPRAFAQFHECWWDSLIIDLLGANLLGMVLGLYTLRFLETRTFDWSQKDGSGRLASSLVSTRAPPAIRHSQSETCFLTCDFHKNNRKVYSPFGRFIDLHASPPPRRGPKTANLSLIN